MNHLFLFISLVFLLLAQNKEAKKDSIVYGWKHNVYSKLGIINTSFDNWQRGGDNALAWRIETYAQFNETQKSYKWQNSGKFVYGKTKLGSQEIRNTSDEIKISSVYTQILGENGSILNPYVSFTFITQFSAGFNYDSIPPKQISNFMDPGYVTEAIGLRYSPGELFSLRMGFSAKQTFTKEFSFTADDKETSEIERNKYEYGLELSSELETDVSDNIQFSSKLQVFSNLEAINQVDVDWDNYFISPLSKYISVNLNMAIFYDRDFSKKRQLKSVFSLGISYTFL
ncbi:MAG: DUF3078 domain-containing protein [Calditrichaeota bacterium]|nr:DUF3078 domain-containing protein [Calditrichota bacterium]